MTGTSTITFAYIFSPPKLFYYLLYHIELPFVVAYAILLYCKNKKPRGTPLTIYLIYTCSGLLSSRIVNFPAAISSNARPTFLCDS